ncbi:uncharacterized protein MESR4 isoform X2 [Diabrotica undecimpunctata]|uniref:uncharacterized protein MESR4 isoform X2 n=1 Tax=Diabrotica undecimpunctata TaxID=50387 RepID=UPI003B636EBB
MLDILVQNVNGCRKDNKNQSKFVMENGPKDPFLEAWVSEHTKNGVVAPVITKFPGGNDATNQLEKLDYEVPKINGDSTRISNIEENSYSSESDALVINESDNRQENSKTELYKNLTLNNSEKDILNNVSETTSETVTHSNPYFNESLFELSQLHQSSQEEELVVNTKDNKFEKSVKKLKKKLKPKQRITEYAQYLGLQPSVQFKCFKCNRAGFESLPSLQEHLVQCDEENVQEVSQDNNYSGFKLTRKVFLCSACGTYYENWNLYIHMLEFHKRFICLYCLGMFSILEDLCQHIQSRHNLEPGYKNTLDEFFNVYNEPCYLACCECDKLFSEQDNFFYHNCTGKNKFKKQPVKQLITPENHVTGESETIIENIEEETENPENTQVMENCNMQENITDSIENEKYKDDDVPKIDTNIKNEEIDENSYSSKENNTSDKMFKEQNDFLEDLNHNDDHNDEIHSPDLTIDNENTNNCNDNYDTSSNKSNDRNSFNDIQADEEDDTIKEEPEEYKEDTRKVPKLSLKLPKFDAYEAEPEDSNDSEKLTMEVDQIESEYENDMENGDEHNSTKDQDQEIDEVKEEPKESDQEEPANKPTPQFVVAGPDTAIIELQLEQPLDKFDPRVLLQKCLKMTAPTCIYCNHARKISVNGKQLGLHCIAEHRFSAIVNSITAEELIPQNFVNRITESLEELSSSFFSLESSFSDEAITFSHGFECFQCHFSTTVHKEHYLHNRRFHSKSLLLCIMCKSNFYTYSELVCHLCPGVYILDYELKFKCCMCVHDDLPSSFRLMVHLRKKHNVCDVCLDSCHTQHRLSNHVWKHKLHHFCYRCAIAYRNKSDIQRHLFWKHGTESVQCKKCLQRKWRHVYHFCVPPASFSCDECALSLRSAVALKVHKRLHTDEKKHSCTFEGCEEKFISKKLLEKHVKRHLEPPEEPKVEQEPIAEEIKEEVDNNEAEPKKEEEKVEEKPKQKIDVLEDLPALNLSESDSSSDSEAEPEPQIKPETKPDSVTELEPPGDLPPLDILQQDKTSSDFPVEEISNIVMQNIWDNFKNYQQQQHKLDTMFGDQEKMEDIVDSYVEKSDNFIIDIIMRDHNYCAKLEDVPKDTTIVEVKPALNESVDHDYCFVKPEIEEEKVEPIPEQPVEPPKVEVKEDKKPGSSSSSSSSDSDSSSCSCGSNCSCSSSSGSSSSSSDSSSSESSSEEGKKRQLTKKQKRKERAKKLKEQQEKATKVDVVTDSAPVIIETPIRESDLETTESDTDEEFYDIAPHLLAKKILEEKRQQLLELMGPNNVPNGSFIESTSRPPTPPPEVVEQEQEEKRKKKSKSKKKKKRKAEKKPIEVSEEITNNIISPDIPIPPYYQQFHQQIQQQQELQQQQEQQQQIQPQPLTVAPITLTIPKTPISSPSASVSTPVQTAPYSKVQTESLYSRRDSSSESSLRASKRRRVPNKFYGYSSDEEQDKPAPKWRKTDTPQTPRSPLVVPPITIRAQPTPPPPQPTIEPISIRTGTHLSDFRVQRPRPKPSIPPIRLLGTRHLGGDGDSESDSNDSSSEEPSVTPKPAQPQLYCYCQCPYDEVSEMIGCDATDCEIEWFHFECVGIMVPPKGQWFCPDCRKKKARRELMANMKNN